MAFEYMLTYVLQKKDLERFMKYYPLGKDLGYNHIPISYQEALIFIGHSSILISKAFLGASPATYWKG